MPLHHTRRLRYCIGKLLKIALQTGRTGRGGREDGRGRVAAEEGGERRPGGFRLDLTAPAVQRRPQQLTDRLLLPPPNPPPPPSTRVSVTVLVTSLGKGTISVNPSQHVPGHGWRHCRGDRDSELVGEGRKGRAS